MVATSDLTSRPAAQRKPLGLPRGPRRPPRTAHWILLSQKRVSKKFIFVIDFARARARPTPFKTSVHPWLRSRKFWAKWHCSLTEISRESTDFWARANRMPQGKQKRPLSGLQAIERGPGYRHTDDPGAAGCRRTALPGARRGRPPRPAAAPPLRL